MEDTLADIAVYDQRQRVCNLGYLRVPYLKNDGNVGYRCASEPIKAYEVTRLRITTTLVIRLRMMMTLSCSNDRKRGCNLGYLRAPYLKDDGNVGYR